MEEIWKAVTRQDVKNVKICRQDNEEIQDSSNIYPQDFKNAYELLPRSSSLRTRTRLNIKYKACECTADISDYAWLYFRFCNGGPAKSSASRTPSNNA